MKTIPAFFAAILLMQAGAAFSQQAPAESIDACKGDAQKFCSGIAPGGGKIKDCLTAHEADLSPSCMAIVTKKQDDRNAGARAFADACGADTKSFCKGVKPGQGRILDCLVDHQNDITEACYQILKKHQDAQDSASNKNQQ
jgi:hypothetical protein